MTGGGWGFVCPLPDNARTSAGRIKKVHRGICTIWKVTSTNLGIARHYFTEMGYGELDDWKRNRLNTMMNQFINVGRNLGLHQFV
ncbi:hypothetical protein BPAE_0169g00270 [Botrytis paeoniae]|uniref:Uncharacterized protein n=1 Tax=Botrytis paeoniae TaxID=278948 RepID=A0A4Z1FGI7_9HELO|nr:hypothetical protein BPAE_0169g00270 [Botrytis paeoniae]